jgi:predicted metalloprotease with PDZ domain
MYELYHEFAKKGKGVSINDYKLTLEKFIGQSLNELFENYVFGTHDYLLLLKNALSYIGLEIKITPNHKSYISIYGFKCVPNGEHFTVKSIYPNSPAENSMLELEDEIIAVNNYDTAGELEKWFAFFKTKEIHLLVKRKGHYHNLHLMNNSSNYTYYNNYSVKKNQHPSESVIENYEHWSK